MTVFLIEKHNKKINNILVKHTGQSMKKIETDSDRDFFMTPEEAKNYGLIDKVIGV